MPQAVESLIAGEAESPESFEWLRQVRHSWDPETGALTVAFAQSVLRYGWEYDGNGLDCITLTSPMSMDGLLAAISALGSSPVVSLPMGEYQWFIYFFSFWVWLWDLGLGGLGPGNLFWA